MKTPNENARDQNQNELRLTIAIPSGDQWERKFGLSLAMMMTTFSQPIPPYKGLSVRVHNRKGSILPNSRQGLVKLAQEFKSTHILFLDSDMVFPAKTAQWLLASKKPVIACNCPTKIIPATTTARRKSDYHAGQPITSHDKEGIEQIWRVGTGVMLIEMSVFDKIEKPYFPLTYKPGVDDAQGEDWGFCEKLENAGIPIFVDHDLSKHILHTGAFDYSHDLVGEVVREEVEGQPLKAVG